MNWLTLIAAGIAFVVGIILVPVFIPILKKLKFGQQVREDGPQAHLKKSGIPTMGGICIVIAMIIGTAVFFPQTAAHTVPVVACTFLFALIGFLDDYLKIKKKQSEGLKAWQKMALQIIFMVALMLYVVLGTENGTSTMIPFYGMVDLKGWFYPIAILAILGTVNGANFTDGLDGLASSVTIVITLFFTVATAMLSHFLDPASLAMLGALAAFLVFNHYPAKIFMGDTGSLALGGYVAAEAFILKMPIMLILVAFIYLIEIISVILQVGYFKLTHGKRLFRMAPIHHHFELGGWSEVKVVIMFTIITLVLSIIGILGIR
ncbi:MAG: phospho-N-acetylmuramoyl-pentapeptide-transferase [Lachnospiraceae bacterium]|nr:phospho-N-acetylmuramoyl-pentapeptide-transferase [Lachnospiraceae bacterium]